VHRLLATLAVLAPLALPAALPAFAEEAKVPMLTATGDGKVMVAPDIAIVTLGVVSQARTAGAALTANSNDMAKVIAAIRAAGVADKDIATTGISLEPVYEQPPARDDGSQDPPRVTGYRAANQVSVTLRALAASGAILDKVVAAGANQVNQISFTVADEKKPADAALADAIADATRKAALMADAAGEKLVRILSISTAEAGGPRPYFDAPPMAMRAAPIMPGERAITATATVTWEIAPK
jgi:uncharacterized protein YggE